MDYPHRFFEDEVREGFYIMGEMKRVWAAQIEVLFEIDRICKKHNIKWFADNGTLLGTIRHKGYIPWDDDLDICMLRDDYFKFKQVAKAELSDGYACLTLSDDEPFYEYLMRITNGRKFNYDEDFLNKFHDCQYPVGVDIFPLDYVALNEGNENARKEIALQVMACADSIDEEDAEAENNPEFKELVKAVEDLCGVSIDSWKPIKQRMFMAAETLFTLYGSKDAKEVVLMPYWLQKNNHKYPIECFREAVMMPFENIELPVPVEYDKVLRTEYGNYMRLNKAGGVHGYPFFEQLEDLLIEKIDKYYYRYKFNPDDLKNDERKNKITTKKQVANYIAMTGEAHEAIVLMVSQGKLDVACNLLAACQESTINIGNLLEAAYGEGFDAVSVLEEYCESVYQLYQAIAGGEFGSEDTAGIAAFLSDIFERMKQILKERVTERKEIVFIPYRADYWNSMKAMWKRAVKEGSYDVYVVPVPYYRKTARSELTEMYYEGDKFPDYLNITDYKEYNFEKRHPDIIVTQNPFDECNYVLSLGREHYSRNLKKHTDKLIYIQPFIIDEIEDEESKAWKTLDYFCAVPGVVRADKVIVQSEKMRGTYIKRLTQMAGEDTADIWKEKVLGISSAVWCELLEITSEGQEVEEKSDEGLELRKEKTDKLPDEWKKIIIKPNGDIKKIILYNVSVATFAQAGEKIIPKIEHTLEVFKGACEDTAVIWYVNPHLQRVLKKINLILKDKFERLAKQYKADGWGIYSESGAYEELVELADDFYGDPGNTAHIMRNDKRPVMLQNVDILN